ncbi:MAG: response regulator [Selenomonadaceae bacterium]|nr:response regulator [Selenomonadaceae bacterium]
MERAQKSEIRRLAVIGGVIIMVLLGLGTFWTGKNAGEDTQTAVRTVSLIYLDELAGRREQVVASTLASYINNLDVAIGLMDKDDLSDKAHLEAYQARMKQLYGLEKFAFVDMDGLIYTSRGTRTDIDQYSFDYTQLSEPEISIKNPDGNNKKVIVAVPVDRLAFEGKTLVVCFMEIDMNRMLESISLQAGTENNITFCNIYTHGGAALTNVVLGGLASENNLLKALENAAFEKGHSLSAMREDFQAGHGGVVSFTYNDIRETMCYVPVHGTDWMLTYLVRESVIESRISSIYDGIVSRGLAQSVLTVLVLGALASIMLLQTRRAAKMTMEKEISETENRVKQQELEEQLALQEELLAQEQQKTQQDSMITALASDYRSVYYVDLDTDQGICYRKGHDHLGAVEEGESFGFREKFFAYADKYVAEEYRAGFREFIRPSAIREALEKNAVISYRYLVKHDGEERYEMLKMARAKSKEEGEDNSNLLGVGFTDSDAEMRDSMQKSQALSEALKTAEEASKAKTVFLSNMSHEIRTPMNAIIGLDSLALHEPNLADSTREYLEKIDSSAKHLLSLINDILDMSRIESGRMVIRNEEFSFAKFLEQINIIAGGQCEEKGVAYDCRLSGPIASYYIGDQGKLRQAIINLLGNAVKFTPKGGKVDFWVERIGGFDGKSAFRFTVKDTGIGMKKEFLPKLFDTFSQEDTTAANKYGSSGLGMAITKNIIEMMNGKIEVESEKGVGTTFTVTVTLRDSDKKDEDDGQDVEIRPQDMSVLVIDDDPIACEHAKVVLGQAGIVTETTLSGKDALEKIRLRQARREPYQLIVVDWHMPDMDGVEVTRQIRSIIGDDAAIIILTAYNWDDVMEEAVTAGVDSFISKPLFFGSLIEEFKKTLKKKQILLSVPRQKVELKGRRVLLAEDMPVNAEIMKQVLTMREVESELAENGKIAVEMFAAHPENYYDAILMDMRMPEMDGLEATTTIRAMSRPDAKKIPIIALTANAFDEDVQRSLQAGLNAHLSKPVDPEILFETLENMLGAKDI